MLDAVKFSVFPLCNFIWYVHVQKLEDVFVKVPFLFVHFITDLIYTPKILWKAVHDVPCKSATIPVDYVTTAECNQVFCFETFCSLKGLCKCVSGLFFIH